MCLSLAIIFRTWRIRETPYRSSLGAQQVKVLSLMWLWSQLWHGFDPWSGNFHLLQPKKRERKRERDSLFI